MMDKINNSSKTVNTGRNALASYFLMIIQTVFQFVSKSVIVYELGSQILGLTNLFSSIITILNLTEMGFTASIVYFLYKPISDSDYSRICSILNYIKNVYRIVGYAILLLGVILMPFLPIIINRTSEIPCNVYVIFFLYLINTVAGYFLYSYKVVFLTAIQRLDLTKIATLFVIVFQYSTQLIVLIYFKNIYFFTLLMVIGTIFTNLIISFICQCKFSRYVPKGKITKTDKNVILSKVKGLLVCNISIVSYSALDNIVISSLIGLTSVAIYSNYMTIYKFVNQLVVILRSSMQSSIGESVVKKTVQENLDDVFLWQFLFSIMGIICSSCMIVLYQPFMKMWMGNNMLLNMLDVTLIVIWFFIDVVQQSQFLYLNAAGLWNNLKASYVFNCFCNVICNISLGYFWGITGVIISSIITCLISGTFWQCIIIFKIYFKIAACKYIYIQFKYFIIGSIVVLIVYYANSFVHLSGIYEIAFKLPFSVLISFILTLLIFFKDKNTKRMFTILARIISYLKKIIW